MSKARVKAIGEHAIDEKDRMIILFGETATEELKKVSIIQVFEKPVKNVQLVKGSQIVIDDQVYTATHVGKLATDHLNTLGHISLVFTEKPEEDALMNAVYLEPFDFPKIHEGTVISYK